jgi:hypothetical protein
MNFLVAIVAGIVGSIGVVVGVVLAPRVTDRLDARHRVASITSEVTDLMTRFLLPFIDPASHFDIGWRDGNERLSLLLVDLRTAAGHLARNEAAKVEAAIDELTVYWFAALMRSGHKSFAQQDQQALARASAELNRVVGRRQPLNEEGMKRIQWLAKNGLDSEWPPQGPKDVSS